MVFLIHYDRTLGRMMELREFSDAQREEAALARLDLEIELLARGNGYEVVLLEASSLDILRNTHRRYFESFEKMKASPEGGT